MTRRVPLALLLLGLATTGASAASYEFVPAPQADLNRMYRVDKVTGEVTSCQYGLQESGGGIGLTVCFAAGEGAGPQTPSEYGLVATRHTREAGVFRVNYRTGELSICTVEPDSFRSTRKRSSTAASSLAWAAKWIAAFELWMLGTLSTSEFAGHRI